MEIQWCDLRELQLQREMDAIASSSVQAISERKVDERLAAECKKQSLLYKAGKARVIAVRTQSM